MNWDSFLEFFGHFFILSKLDLTPDPQWGSFGAVLKERSLGWLTFCGGADRLSCLVSPLSSLSGQAAGPLSHPSQDLATVTYAVVTSKLDYCNLLPVYLIRKL